MQPLQVFIDCLTANRNLHISILDLSGILNTPLTRCDYHNVIHSTHFCDLAKSSAKGYRTCLRCKMFANKRAVKKEAFCGHCAYGLCEAAFPVIRNENVVAVVYVGNAVLDRETTLRQITKTCSFTGVSENKLIKELSRCEKISSPAELLQIAEIVADYIKLLYDNSIPQSQETHWLVSLMKSYADKIYRANVSLKDVAKTYGKNEKYLGRLFKKEMGVGFNEYCMEVRLKKAKQLLLSSDAKIIDVAYNCGFNNVSYFNRSFKKKYGTSPKTYRSNHKSL